MTRIRIVAVCAMVLLIACEQQAVEIQQPPNVILIVADDLGYTDLGLFGSEIETPNIDALARDGVTLTNFHANATCTPSRAMLLTGMDNHRVGYGLNPGVANRIPEIKGQPGYRGEFRSGIPSLANRFKDAGYTTLQVGKWHLGSNQSSWPPAQGYDRSFYLVEGGASHFSDGYGTLSNEHPAQYWEDKERVKKLPGNFFSSTFYTDKIIAYIDDSVREDQPYFAHVAYTAPHWPLQAPDTWLDKYDGRYDRGWLATRSERLERMVAAGLLDQSATVSPLPEVLGSWEQLSDDEKRVESRRMEIYAAMIAHLDHEVGRLIDFLKSNGQYDNTIIVFLSDNGPEGNDVMQIRDNADWIPTVFDLDYESMGTEGSYTWLGRGWAHVSAGPFAMYKSFLSEGGSRVPLIVKLPEQGSGNNVNDQLVSIIDIAPTVLDVAGIELEKNRPMQGVSIAKTLVDGSVPLNREDPVAFEMYGGRTVFRGRWKLSWLGPPAGSGEWELFDLATDPGETLNRATEYPDLVIELERAWNAFADENDVHRFDRDLGYGRYPDQKVRPRID
jgi:arylsulfatase